VAVASPLGSVSIAGGIKKKGITNFDAACCRTTFSKTHALHLCHFLALFYGDFS
jgi:hypothetical protein